MTGNPERSETLSQQAGRGAWGAFLSSSERDALRCRGGMALTGEGVVFTEGGLTPETLSGDSAPAMPLLRVCLLPRPPSAASAGARGSQFHPTRRDAGGSGRGLSWARVPAISGQTLSPPGATGDCPWKRVCARAGGGWEEPSGCRG